MNKQDLPVVHSRITKNPGFSGTVYEYSHFFYAAKFKDGKYRLKHRFMVSTEPLKDVQQNFLKDTKDVIKRGRYSDYFYVERPEGIYELH